MTLPPAGSRSAFLSKRSSDVLANCGSAMGFVMQDRKQFVVTCKRCRRDVPAGVKEFLFQSIEVTCPLCGEQRRYLPSEVLLGRSNHQVVKQARP